jgi:hypothetical protein
MSLLPFRVGFEPMDPLKACVGEELDCADLVREAS